VHATLLGAVLGAAVPVPASSDDPE